MQEPPPAEHWYPVGDAQFVFPLARRTPASNRNSPGPFCLHMLPKNRMGFPFEPAGKKVSGCPSWCAEQPPATGEHRSTRSFIACHAHIPAMRRSSRVCPDCIRAQSAPMCTPNRSGGNEKGIPVQATPSGPTMATNSDFLRFRWYHRQSIHRHRHRPAPLPTQAPPQTSSHKPPQTPKRRRYSLP